MRNKTELSLALRGCRSAIYAIAFASALVNILYLTGAIYMMEVYDRVLASRSIPTLIGLSLLALILFAFQGTLDLLRTRLLVRIARWMGDVLDLRVYECIGRAALATRAGDDALQPLRDTDQIRNFLSGSGPLAILDLPWLPLYVGACFVLHFWIGITALAGATILVFLTLLTEGLSRNLSREATVLTARRSVLAEASRRNAGVLKAMGIGPRFGSLWSEVSRQALDSTQRASDITGGLGAMSKVTRLALQSAVLGVGAYLVINQQSSPGVIIAGSIISGRALAPIDLAIANWRGFLAFRQSWQRMKDLLRRYPGEQKRIDLPRPRSNFVVERVTLVPPGTTEAVVHNITFRIEKGSALGIIGPSGAGKSSLARALVGLWQPVKGSIRIDGAALSQWNVSALGEHIGYLPQEVELLGGTVAQNISRFDRRPDSEAVIAAAKAAGVHDLILRLPEGYETELADGGSSLSAGQRQRIALARALYKNPFLLVLDEPNSNLDSEGDEALSRAILEARTRGGVVIVIAHRPSALANVDLVLTMAQGHLHMFGPKEEVLNKLRRPTSNLIERLRVVSEMSE
jgi:ATP-binding cassette subfamily C protein